MRIKPKRPRLGVRWGLPPSADDGRQEREKL
nr:MAG TPA: hypothetical protein [Bacteriophage sp.]